MIHLCKLALINDSQPRDHYYPHSQWLQVIVYKYPQLTTVVDRLLDIYFLLSAGRHDTSDDMTQDVKSDADIGKFLTRDGRLISTRSVFLCNSFLDYCI